METAKCVHWTMEGQRNLSDGAMLEAENVTCFIPFGLHGYSAPAARSSANFKDLLNNMQVNTSKGNSFLQPFQNVVR